MTAIITGRCEITTTNGIEAHTYSADAAIVTGPTPTPADVYNAILESLSIGLKNSNDFFNKAIAAHGGDDHGDDDDDDTLIGADHDNDGDTNGGNGDGNGNGNGSDDISDGVTETATKKSRKATQKVPAKKKSRGSAAAATSNDATPVDTTE